MTVTVMTAGRPAEEQRSQPTVPDVSDEVGQASENIERPVVYSEQENAYSKHFASARRRKSGSFGNIVFVQLVLSAVLAFGVWAGNTFGGEEIRSVCTALISLFG